MPESQDASQSWVENTKESRIKQGNFGEYLQQNTQCLL